MKLWIARDGDGQLYLFENKPVLNGCDAVDYLYFTSKNVMEGYIKLPRDYFPEVTFENSPREVELKLI